MDTKVHLQVKMFSESGLKELEEGLNKWLLEHMAQAVASVVFSIQPDRDIYVCHVVYMVGEVEGFKPARGH